MTGAGSESAQSELEHIATVVEGRSLAPTIYVYGSTGTGTAGVIGPSRVFDRVARAATSFQIKQEG